MMDHNVITTTLRNASKPSGHLAIVQVLLDQRASPNLPERHGATALHLRPQQNAGKILPFLPSWCQKDGGSIKDRSEKVEFKKARGPMLEVVFWNMLFILYPETLGGNDPIWRMDIFQMGWLQLPTRILFL